MHAGFDDEFARKAVEDGLMSPEAVEQCRRAGGSKSIAEVAIDKGVIDAAAALAVVARTTAADLFGKIAVERGYVSKDRLDECVSEQRSDPALMLGQILIQKGYLRTDQFLDILRLQKNVSGERRIGRYLLGEILGEGAMGVVFRARDEQLGRDVAVKMLKVAQGTDALQVERFHREAQNAARLRHPNIVTIYEVGRDGETLYYAMEHVPGRTLSGLFGDRPAFLRVLEKAARAVQYAHEQGVIHRDLKPNNILVDSGGAPHILDFGLSRALDAPSDLTRSGTVLGTPQYMPPEQARGLVHEVDARSDVYALGAILYEGLTGRLPFTGATALEMLRRMLTEEPEPPRRLNPSIPADLETICLKALEKDRARRYASAAEFADDLAHALAGEPIQARPASLMYRVRRRIARHPAAIATVVVILAVVGWAIHRIRRTERAAGDYQTAYHEGMEHWERAVALVRADAFDRALVERFAAQAVDRFSRAADAAPDRPEPWLMMGRCWMLAGRGEDAESAWGEALRRDPAFAMARFERGKYYLVHYVRSRVSPAATVSEGRVRFGAREPEDAREKEWRLKGEADLAEARKSPLGGVEGKYLEGALAYGQGRFADAAAALQVYVEQSPWDSHALALHGNACYMSGRFLEADASLTRALRLLSRVQWHKSRGDVRLCIGKYDGAFEDYVAVLRSDPDNADVLCSRALALQGLARLADAERDCTRAMELRKDFARAYNTRGTTRAARQDLDGAVADFKEAVRIHAMYVEAYNNLGSAYVLQGRLVDAIVEFVTATEIDPGYAEAFKNCGLARKANKDFEGAVKDYLEALRLVPKYVVVRYYLALAYSELNRMAEAREQLRRALDDAPRDWPMRAEVEKRLTEWK